MLRNGDKLIKNDDVIFKSQVVDSYLKTNETSTVYITTSLSGLSASNSLSVYYKRTPTATLKCTYTSDIPSTQINFGVSGTDNYKPWYFCGNLGSVRSIVPYTNSFPRLTGDLPAFANQFPNLTCLDMARRETDFNQDISYCAFPRNLTTFELRDAGIQGDLGTISGLNNLEKINLNCTQSLYGDVSPSIANPNLKCVNFYYIPSSNFTPDIDCLINTSTGLTHLCLYYDGCVRWCAENTDVSDIERLYVYTSSNGCMKGDISNWCFNTGLTYFSLASRCFTGDITNWNIEDTQVGYFYLYNYGGSASPISGSLSGWTIPSTMTSFNLGNLCGITSIPSDWSNATSLQSMSLQQLPALSGDINTYNFPDINNLTINSTNLSGNLEDYSFYSGMTNPNFRTNSFTGNLSGITVGENTTYLYLEGNCLSGDINDFYIPDTLQYLGLGNNPDVYLNLDTTFDTNNANQICIGNISGITGDFNNFPIKPSLLYLYMDCSNITASNLGNIDTTCLNYLYLHRANIAQDVTPLFTGGTSNLSTICLCYNPLMSGDTTNWVVDDICRVLLGDTSLSGRLCHCNPYCLTINSTNISSCIDTDLDFSIRGYNFCGQASCIQGDLGSLSLNYGTIRNFFVQINSNLTGSNAFTDDIFINRKNFVQNYISLDWSSIGDTVTGTSEVLGSLGTYGGDPSGMDLTEEQVNNLVAGLDYNGSGTNTPWDSKNKIWWMKNACVSSSSTAKRYSTFNITY